MKNNQYRAIRDLMRAFAVQMADHVSVMETLTPFTAIDTHDEIKKAWETLDTFTELVFGRDAAEMLNDWKEAEEPITVKS